MTSTRPYLIRAFYEWIIDNGWIPYLAVDATIKGCQIPTEYTNQGHIIFNINTHVVHDLVLGNKSIKFIARFAGKSVAIYLPVSAVTAIYAKENGEGILFPVESFGIEEDDNTPPPPPPKKPILEIVK